MAVSKYVRGYYRFHCPCIYMVSVVSKGRFVYEIAVNATDGDGNLLDEKPLCLKEVKGWLRAKIEFNKIYKEYDKKVNGGNSRLW